MVLVLFLGQGRAFAQTQWPPTIHGEYDLSGAYHATGGAGDKTLIRKGAFLSNDLKLNIEDALSDDWNTTTDLHARQTPDPQIDKRKNVHLLGWTTEIYNPFLRFTGGDFYGDFSQYTLTQSLRGVQAAFKNEVQEVKIVAGYSQDADEGVNFRRYVFGGRSETLLAKEYGPAKDVRMGFNFVDSEDGHNTIQNDSGILDASNRVASVNSHVLLWDKTDIEGEMAQSWSDEDTSDGSATDRRNGTALRLNSNTKFSKKAKARLGYEWVTAGFNSLSGSSVPDRINVTSRFDYKFDRIWSMDAGYRLNFDRLDSSALPVRTTTQTPRVALNWNPESEDWLLQDYESRFFWEQRRRTSSEESNTGQIDYLSNDYGFENDFRVQDVRFDSGWTIRTENDDLDKTNNILSNIGYLGMSMRKKFLGCVATPSLRYQMDYEALTEQEGRDLVNTVTAGLILDITDALRFEQNYSLETASHLLEDSDTCHFNAHLGLSYKIPAKEDVTLRLRYDHTGFAHPSALESFSEENFNADLLWRF